MVIACICYFGELIDGPPCIGLMSAQLSLMGSKHRHTLLLGLGIVTKLLNHLAVSSTPIGASILHSCSFPAFFEWLL